MNIIGIDPGLTGAVAIINGDGNIHIFDTPIVEIKHGKSKKKEYLPAQMSNIFHIDFLIGSKHHVFLEKVHSMPKQGVASTFNFGKGFGIWIGILAALKIPMTFVTPQAWKKKMMHGMGDKDAARIRAQELFPEVVDQLSRKKDIGRADALLIAEYGRCEIDGDSCRIKKTVKRVRRK